MAPGPLPRSDVSQVSALEAAEDYPVIGFTWYSLTDQVDWDIDLREQRFHVVANGLYDMKRRIRCAGLEFQRIVRAWSGELANRACPACAPHWIGVHEPALPAPTPAA